MREDITKYEVQNFIELMNKFKYLIKNEERLEDSPESLKEIYDGIKTPFFEVKFKIRKSEKEIEKVMFGDGILEFEIHNKNNQSNSIVYRLAFTRQMQLSYFSSFYDILIKVEMEVLKKYPIKNIIDNYEKFDNNIFFNVIWNAEKIDIEDCIYYAKMVNKNFIIGSEGYLTFKHCMRRFGLCKEVFSEIIDANENMPLSVILENLTEDDKYMLMLNGILPD